MSGPNPVSFLPQNTPFTIPKEGKLILIVTSTVAANLTFKASEKGRKLGYPAQFSITQNLNAVLPVEGGFFDFVTLTNNATVTVTFGMDIAKDYLNQIASLSPTTPYLNTYNQTTDTILRSIERIVPRNGVVADASAVFSVAAGTGGSTSNYLLPIATYVILQMGISQDTLGTTPHASTLALYDPNAVRVCLVAGAINSPLSVSFYVTRGGNYYFGWNNGDTVSHTFFYNLYAVAT